ncbi:NlpC/P60 family protein [Microcystis sp. M061S2]|uniref:C40 family peptidase n=1 Tax=Microcystis sp. M061S2 TaxID=2771171 RepID=UPI002590D675|nr:NlpC/P60 family protein [Microcystis sp. M061S2]MCA2656371.1 C40 family peptidase [Microcystis sp. M061S2]
MKRELFIQYALQFVGAPYRFGSNGPGDWDCSGLVLEFCRACGLNPPQRDMSAQMIHDWVIKLRNFNQGVPVGTFLFYGKSNKEINHVALLLDAQTLIEAGGGDATTTNLQAAQARGWAMVRLRKIGHRRDLVAQHNPGMVL